MGAWDHGPFDNDTALDFIADLTTTTGHDHLVAAFEAIPGDPEIEVEASESSDALAAAEVVAALLGRPNPDQPDEVAAWVAKNPGADPLLVAEAIRAVERVGRQSELRELWEENDEDFPSWQQSIQDLLSRLR